MKVFPKGTYAQLGPPLMEQFEYYFGPAVGLDAVFAIQNYIGDQEIGYQGPDDEVVGRLTRELGSKLRVSVSRFHSDLRAWLDGGEVTKHAFVAPLLVGRDRAIAHFDELLGRYLMDVANIGEELHNGEIFKLLPQAHAMVQRVDAATDIETQRSALADFITAWGAAGAASSLVMAMNIITSDDGIRFRYAVRRDALARRPDVYTDEPDFISLQQTKSGIDEQVQAFVMDMRGLNDAVAQAHMLVSQREKSQEAIVGAAHAIEKNFVAWYRTYVRLYMQAQSLRIGSWMEDFEHQIIDSLRDQIAKVGETSLLEGSDRLRETWESLKRQLTDATGEYDNLARLKDLQKTLRIMEAVWIKRCEDACQTPGIPEGIQAAFADAKHEINGVIQLPLGVLSVLTLTLQGSVVTDEYHSEAFVTGVRRLFQCTNLWVSRRKHMQEKKNGKSVIDEIKVIFGQQGVIIEREEELPAIYDRPALRMILIHQIQNALRATANVVDGRVRVIFYKNRVVVEDNGTGFSPEALAVLQLEKPDTEAQPLPPEIADGTGQGLWSIRKQLIPELGPNAAMEVESEIGKGSRVTTYFNKQK